MCNYLAALGGTNRYDEPDIRPPSATVVDAMSRRGHFAGGHTVIGLKSGWFSETKPKSKRAKKKRPNKEKPILAREETPWEAPQVWPIVKRSAVTQIADTKSKAVPVEAPMRKKLRNRLEAFRKQRAERLQQLPDRERDAMNVSERGSPRKPTPTK